MTRPEPGPNGHVFIVSAARTPIGKFGGALSGTPAVALGGVAIRAAVERAGLGPETVAVDAPYLVPGARFGLRLGNGELIGSVAMAIERV